VRALNGYLREHPATHILAAALAGYEAPAKPQEQSLDTLLAAFGAAGFNVQGKIELPKN